MPPLTRGPLPAALAAISFSFFCSSLCLACRAWRKKDFQMNGHLWYKIPCLHRPAHVPASWQPSEASFYHLRVQTWCSMFWNVKHFIVRVILKMSSIILQNKNLQRKIIRWLEQENSFSNWSSFWVCTLNTTSYNTSTGGIGQWSGPKLSSQACCKFLDAALLNFETQVMDDEIAKCVIDIIYWNSNTSHKFT